MQHHVVPAPYNHRVLIGHAFNYYIHDGYVSRVEEVPYDDTVNKDEFQSVVYHYAKQVRDECGLKLVIDVGCGSGYKLVNKFRDCATLGLDTPATVRFLHAAFPNHCWAVCDLYKQPMPSPDTLVICSDVVEHLLEPDLLMRYLLELAPKRLVISTPAREQLCLGTDDGPPRNVHHIREWSVPQFHAYVEAWFKIRHHFTQGDTQIVEAELK